eukprot:scaffold693_cov54-Cylindrotheca_fusiformis.AAC.2
MKVLDNGLTYVLSSSYLPPNRKYHVCDPSFLCSRWDRVTHSIKSSQKERNFESYETTLFMSTIHPTAGQNVENVDDGKLDITLFGS